MMKTYFLIPFASILMMSCGNNQQPTEEPTTETPSTEVNAVADYDPKRGEGRFNAENVIVGNLNNDDA